MGAVRTSNYHGLFTRAEALEAGLTDNQLRRSPEYKRVIHGVYRLASKPPTHELRCLAASLVLPENAVVTGKSAATLHGVPLARPHDPVEVIVAGCKRFYGIRNWDVRCYPFEHLPWAGIRLATVLRTAFELLARNPIPWGVGYCDALLHAGLVAKEALGKYLEGRHDHGIVRARKAFQLLDRRADSIPESVLRVLLVNAGLDPVPQLEIPGEYGMLRADLGFEKEKVLVEYEGAWHAEPEQFRRDQARRAWLRENGWTVVVVTAQDLAGDPERIVGMVRSALAHRGSFA